MRYLPFLLLLLSGTLASCGSGYIYQKTWSIAETGWDYADSLVFEFEATDTAGRFDLLLDLAHADTFGNQNLYIRIHTYFPDGKSDTRSVSLELADKAGYWFGRCRSGNCSLQLVLQEAAVFQQAGTYRFVIEQYTRVNPLPGVKSLSLAVQKAGS